MVNLDYTHLKETCQEIIKRQINVNWSSNFVPNKDFIDFMPLIKESGAAYFATGIKSLSNEILNNIKKDRSVDEAILISKKSNKL